VTTFVVGDRVIEIEVERDDVPRSLGVTVRIDGRRRWSSVEPGWRELGVGTSLARTYLWSARRLIVLPIDYERSVMTVDLDEDIIATFDVGGSWLLVCETSVRLFVSEQEVSRLELADAVVSARWKDDELAVQYEAGLSTRVALSDGRLLVVS